MSSFNKLRVSLEKIKKGKFNLLPLVKVTWKPKLLRIQPTTARTSSSLTPAHINRNQKIDILLNKFDTIMKVILNVAEKVDLLQICWNLYLLIFYPKYPKYPK